MNWIRKAGGALREKDGRSKVGILKSPVFLAALGIKLAAAALFGSEFLTRLFIPFLNYYGQSGFQNPYEYFASAGGAAHFPYGAIMLWFVGLPGILLAPIMRAAEGISHLDLFLYRLPILFADIVILLILARWLKGKEKKVLIYYWCSPVLFYINYVHGQLDSVPIMFLFVALYFLCKEKWKEAGVFLGIAIAAKIHILALVPFTLVYVFRIGAGGLRRAGAFFCLTFGTWILANAPFLSSAEFRRVITGGEEGEKIFDLKIVLGAGAVIYIVPAVYVALFVRSLAFRRYNRDIFLMFLGFSFGILTALIAPMPGWYYWVLPFLLYFYIKQENAPRYAFAALQALYILFFLLVPNSDIPGAFFPLSPESAGVIPRAYAVLARAGWSAEKILRIIFTLLQTALLVNVIWIYKKGVESNTKYKIYYEPYLVGISGDSGSGKSTVARFLRAVFGEKNTAIIEGDDAHKWERGHEAWKAFTHLDPRANNLHGEVESVAKLKEGRPVERRRYDHSSGRFTLPEKLESKRIVVFEGLHSLFLESMRRRLDMRVFMDTDEDLRLRWKMERDMRERGKAKEGVLEQIKKREKDRIFIQAQKKYADLIIAPKSGDGERSVIIGWECANSVGMDPLLVALAEEGMGVEHELFEERQRGEIRGDISKEAIEKIAYRILPELWDAAREDPEWKNGHEGVIQILLVYVIFGRMKSQESWI